MNKLQLESLLPIKGAENASPGAKQPRGSFLIETTISLFVLVAIAIVLVDASFNILKPRTWTMKTNLVDAYLSQEVALMNNLDFADITAGTDSSGETAGWGTGANITSTAQSADAVRVLAADGSFNVPMGKMPGFVAGAGNGRDYTAEVYRVRIVPSPWISNTGVADPAAVADFNKDAAATALTMADTGVYCYELQTHVVYTVGNDTYVKTRSVIRSQ